METILINNKVCIQWSCNVNNKPPRELIITFPTSFVSMMYGYSWGHIISGNNNDYMASVQSYSKSQVTLRVDPGGSIHATGYYFTCIGT